MKEIRSRARRWVPRVVLIGLAGFSLAGIYAFKRVFPHSGEQALDLVPETALAAGTLDLDPAPSQVLVFRQIDDSLKRNGFEDSLGAMARKAANGFSDQKALLALSRNTVSACIFFGHRQIEGHYGSGSYPHHRSREGGADPSNSGTARILEGDKIFSASPCSIRNHAGGRNARGGNRAVGAS
jgi:hypothetical protein